MVIIASEIMRRLLAFIAMALIAALPAVFFAIVSYLVWLPGSGRSASAVLRFSALLAPGMLLTGLPIATAVGAAIASLRTRRLTPAGVLIAVLGGVLWGVFASYHSPHVSRFRAATCGGASAGAVAAAILTLYDRRRSLRSGL